MLKGAVLEKIKGILDEWLIGFDSERDFNVALFSSEKVNVKNAMINPERVNLELAKLEVPFRLKAGMIGRLSVKTNLMNLFSDSANVEIQDIHIIMGTSRDNMAHASDYM